MRDPVAAAESLRHRVAEREHRPAERHPGMHRALEQTRPLVEIARLLDDAWKVGRDQPRPRQRMQVRLGVVSLDVQRLRAMRERVHRRPHGLGAGEVEREERLVDDAGEVCAGAPAGHPPVGVPDAEERRPLRAGVGGRDRDDRHRRLRGDRLGKVDGAAASERDRRVARPGGGVGDTARRHLRPPRRRLERQVLLPPALARDEERPLHAELLQDPRQRRDAPADDHDGRRVRAKSTNACAARVSARPLERTRKISRTGSRPRTRADAIVPAARSASRAVREMNVTP